MSKDYYIYPFLTYNLDDSYFVQVGLIGLVEEEWIETLAAIDKEDVYFLDYVEEGTRLAKELKNEVKRRIFYL